VVNHPPNVVRMSGGGHAHSPLPEYAVRSQRLAGTATGVCRSEPSRPC